MMIFFAIILTALFLNFIINRNNKQKRREESLKLGWLLFFLLLLLLPAQLHANAFLAEQPISLRENLSQTPLAYGLVAFFLILLFLGKIVASKR